MTRFLALNIPPAAVLAAAWHHGYLDLFWQDPKLGTPCAVVFGWFLWAMAALAFGRRELADWLSGFLVLLGLIGTVVGIVFALSSVDPDDIANVETMTPMAAELIRGMGVAFYTTLIGSVSWLWFRICVRWGV